jgi:Zn-dependent protease with chaperone function
MKSLSTSIYIRLFVLIGTFLYSGETFGQWASGYRPRQMHSEDSKELIEELQARFEEERRVMGDSRKVKQLNLERENFFIEKILDGYFVKDDSLENFVNGVLHKISESNSLTSNPKRVLILESPHVNALCYGKGIYAVTVGLLARIETENQLAFILSHELAHD